LNSTVVVTFAYFEPVTHAELRTILGCAVGRESSSVCGMPV
jgi:hypothetical protein